MKIRNIVFDFGRVLVDWSRNYLFDPYFNDAEKCRFFLDNICTPAWCMKSDAGRPMLECIDELKAEWPGWEEPIQLFYDSWMTMCKGEWPGMSELIDELRAAGYAIYGLSNWPMEFFMKSREKVGTLQKVQDYVVSSYVGIAKPDPRIYHHLMEKYGLVPGECLFIDDVQANVDGALAVGMQALLFDGTPDCVRQRISSDLQSDRP